MRRNAFIFSIYLFLILSATLFAQSGSDSVPGLDSLQDALIREYESVQKAIVAIDCQTRKGNFFGTGALISPEGEILTATSVVPQDVTTITVTLSTCEQRPARLLGYEKRNNVVLIKVEGRSLPYLEMGDSSDVQMGDVVLTVGNPLRCITQDATAACSIGSVSGRYRLRGAGSYNGEVLESDAALNPGSDGGPLIDAKGKIIGVLNLAHSYSRWLGTAVPINQIKLIFDDLKEGREISVFYGLLPEDEPREGGIPIAKVTHNSPAAKAGLMPEDIIISINGVRVSEIYQLLNELAILPPGSHLLFQIKRNGKEQIIKLVSGKHAKKKKSKEKQEQKPQPQPHQRADKKPYLGATLTDPSDGGVIIDTLDPSGPAQKAGLRKGDTIVKLNGKQLQNLPQFEQLFGNLHTGDKIVITVVRDGWEKSFEVILGGKEKPIK